MSKIIDEYVEGVKKEIRKDAVMHLANHGWPVNLIADVLQYPVQEVQEYIPDSRYDPEEAKKNRLVTISTGGQEKNDAEMIDHTLLGYYVMYNEDDNANGLFAEDVKEQFIPLTAVETLYCVNGGYWKLRTMSGRIYDFYSDEDGVITPPIIEEFVAGKRKWWEDYS